MLNKRSEQHSLLYFLTGKIDETVFPHPSMAIWFIGYVMWENVKKTTCSVKKFNIHVKCKRECVLIVFIVQLDSVFKDLCS